MIVLASQSSGRLATLRAAGIEPQVEVSAVDEAATLRQLHADHAAHGSSPTPAQQVEALAVAKATEVASRADQLSWPTSPSGTYVIGADSMLELDGHVIGKPRDSADAVARWHAMRGRSAVLHSGHCVVRVGDGERRHAVSSTTVHFGRPTDAEIEAYVATGEPLWCAGAFTIDGLGGAFIEGVDGDPHGVVGLSLPLVRRLLAELGASWTDQWNRVPGAGSAGA